eukprot:scaffold31102_cov110-Isochrysis_galbana.AAC.1
MPLPIFFKSRAACPDAQTPACPPRRPQRHSQTREGAQIPPPSQPSPVLTCQMVAKSSPLGPCCLCHAIVEPTLMWVLVLVSSYVRCALRRSLD